MCGIAGVIVWDEKYRVTRDTLAKMSAAIAHRGPDGEGLFITREHEPITPETPQVAFVFRRLAILDCDDRAMQPMHTPDGRYTIVFNGEIYNFRELRDELSQRLPDHAWRTTGDTEVLLMSFATWGSACVEKLNGMFALAVWDHVEQQLFLARDRMGQKPLYTVATQLGESFAVSELRMDQHERWNALAFASEAATLCKLEWVGRDTAIDRLRRYLRYGTNNWSFYESISALAPGWSQQIQNSTVVEHKYFDAIGLPHPVRGERVGERASSQAPFGLDSNSERASFPLSPVLGGEGQGEGPSGASGAESEDKKRPSPQPSPPRTREREKIFGTRQRVLHAVERQLVSDVPLGLFLSGGIDSSVIAACARKFGPVQTFSIGFDDPRYDETRYAREVAKHLDTTHHEFRVTPDAAVDLMNVAAAFGEPFADSSALPTFYLSRETRKRVTVALSGDGGDELFGGYDRYRAIDASRHIPRLPFDGWLGGVMARGHPKSRVARVGRFLRSLFLPLPKRYASYLRIFDDATIRDLIGPQEPAIERDVVADLFARYTAAGLSPAQAACAVDRITYLPDDLLTKVDRCSMAHGLEVRSPFMDHELVRFAAGLTTDQLLRGGPKRMLREAFADDLPAWVFKRRKMGFAVPIGEWFRGPLRAMLRDNLFASDSFARQHFQMKVVERLIDEHQTFRIDHSQRLYALLMLELWWTSQREHH